MLLRAVAKDIVEGSDIGFRTVDQTILSFEMPVRFRLALNFGCIGSLYHEGRLLYHVQRRDAFILRR